jgi:SPP1 gp7 family putative phage head morphogenesis protein
MADPLQVQPFGIQFDEAISYLKAKLPETTGKWDDLAGPVHAKVFTVAGTTSVEVVKDIHAALVSALENGAGISQFRKDFDKTVQQHGWTYKGQRGWRTSLIFEANMRSAHMAGRWQQLQANKAVRPYLEYRTAGDARVRPMHRAWDGLIFHLDDAFWDTHYPPCGWRCRCTVRAFGASEMADRGLAVSPPYQTQYRDVFDKDGKVIDTVPVGIDPGWDHNVGKSWIGPEQALGQKIAALPTKELKGLFAEKSVSPAFQKVIEANYKAFRARVDASNKLGNYVQLLGFMDRAVLEALANRLPEQALQSTAIFALDNKTSHLKQEGKPDSPQFWPRDWVNLVPSLLRNYRAVLLDTEPGKQALIYLTQETYNDTIPKIVVKLNVKGNLETADRVGKPTKIVGNSVLSYGSASAPDFLNRILVNGKWQNKYEVLVGKIE